MKNALILAVSVSFWLSIDTAAAQEADQTQRTTSFVVARMGQILQPPSTATYHYLEFFQVRGKLILPDVGYIDFADDSYREVFVGGGATLYEGKWLTLTGELYFTQAFGPTAHNAQYLLPWMLLQYRLSDQVSGEVAYFPYLPLNDGATLQHVLERADIEYTVSSLWKFGAGYGCYQFGDQDWQHKPFLTTTFSTDLGSFELWLQRLPGGSQMQIRYQCSWN